LPGDVDAAVGQDREHLLATEPGTPGHGRDDQLPGAIGDLFGESELRPAR
jgi:hypothetical protein